MGYILTGYARSLTVKVTKTVNGVIASGYPKYYDGKSDSGFLAYYAPTYSSISEDEMAKLSLVDFNARVADFMAWIEVVEPGIDMDVDLTVEARIFSDDCTTTTTSTSTSTTTSSSTTSTTTTAEPATTTSTSTTEEILYTSCPAVNDYIEGSQIMPTKYIITLGSDIGWVDLYYRLFSAPDRITVVFDGTTVIDTGYHGETEWDFGGSLRSDPTYGFKENMDYWVSLGYVDPVTGLAYPDLVNYPDDGYPRVSMPSTAIVQWYKDSSTITCEVFVHAPIPGTQWRWQMYCPATTTTTTTVVPTTTTTTIR